MSPITVDHLFGSFQADKSTCISLIMGYRVSYERRWRHFGLPRIRVSGHEALIVRSGESRHA